MQDNQELVREIQRTGTQTTTGIAKVQGELVRKSLHLLVAIVPVLASVNLSATLTLLAMGTLFYAFAESSRRQGNPIFVVSDLTLIRARDRDKTGFVLGPVTLGLGAMVSLLLYPRTCGLHRHLRVGLRRRIRRPGRQGCRRAPNTSPSRKNLLGKPGVLCSGVPDGVSRESSACGVPHHRRRGNGARRHPDRELRQHHHSLRCRDDSHEAARPVGQARGGRAEPA